ncbi:type IV toxin-antitoxin system AbiEi family antitoxin domain-containing protein [Nocardioides massiliensis]|uniref:Type IV toxin-antitoxin system AbiEi family antitoxin domain-containing protein n=1 Tax=Nocardioides massiliensis TaxID=1325935 RepID=A0ABT9NNU9_9ACTN|nr:type IV toxin-antitoxin system AbiEi family antitoxin domain-containing protein [Nocardioides massiliensis]MDP9822098.1 hypothetical protein [Nocardioides massiliensis]
MDLADLLAAQNGVVSRSQLGECDLAPHRIRRLLRTRELASIHPGVYVDHTGPPSWIQRAWAGCLHAWPAALWGPSALRAAEGPGRRATTGVGDEETIHVAIHHARRVRAVSGVTVHRVVDLDEQTLWNLGPPRQRPEDAALDAATHERLPAMDRIGVLARVLGARATTAARTRAALDRRARFPDRAWFEQLLDDLAKGTASVLEHGYLTLVERPHDLPTARRQVWARTASGSVFRDAEYDEQVIVELDGRLFHDSTRSRDRDMDRDLDAALDGRMTVRIGYGQVFDRPCATAGRVGAILRRHGIGDGAHPCGAGCVAAGPSVA